VQSFLKSVDEDGVVFEYLKESVLLAPVGPYLFVHGGQGLSVLMCFVSEANQSETPGRTVKTIISIKLMW